MFSYAADAKHHSKKGRERLYISFWHLATHLLATVFIRISKYVGKVLKIWTDLVAPNFLSDRFTIFYCVSTSSHYRYRCHWERNQILSVCVGPNNRSVWVQSFSQLCSPPSSAQLLVISSVFFFFCWDVFLCFVWQMQTIAFFLFFIYAPCHIALQRQISWIVLLLYLCFCWPGREWL